MEGVLVADDVGMLQGLQDVNFLLHVLSYLDIELLYGYSKARWQMGAAIDPAEGTLPDDVLGVIAIVAESGQFALHNNMEH